jgi:hypothetical protein
VHCDGVVLLVVLLEFKSDGDGEGHQAVAVAVEETDVDDAQEFGAMILDLCCDLQILAGPHREIEVTRGELTSRNVFEQIGVPSD